MFLKQTKTVYQSEVVRKVVSILELVDPPIEDNLMLDRITLILDNYDDEKTETEQLLCSLISLLLNSFSLHLPVGDSLAVKIETLQQRLAVPITSQEHTALQRYIESCADTITESESISRTKISATLEPLVHSFGLDNKSVLFPREIPQAEQTCGAASSFIDDKTQNIWESDVSEFGKSLKHLFSSSYLKDSIEQSEKFGVLLEIELAALMKMEEPASFEHKKSYVLNEMKKVLNSHKEMTEYFQKMSQFISLMQKDTMRLNEELDRVTLLSMTDELTGLPNRRAFHQRLNDEVGRVKRYGHDLSLALLDLDYFKSINDRFGHFAGDNVLKTYATEVLSMFREQDMIARYGGEEFVVIFPNTTIPGALQALKMVQSRAEEIELTLNGIDIQLPTFSSGLVSLRQGESSEALIQRADEALYTAKEKGRNLIEVEAALEIS